MLTVSQWKYTKFLQELPIIEQHLEGKFYNMRKVRLSLKGTNLMKKN